MERENLQWVFDPKRPSGAIQGGLAAAHVIKPDIDNFVREVIQNSKDQRLEDQMVVVRFTFQKLYGEWKDKFLNGIGWQKLQSHTEGAAREGGVTIGPQLARGLEVANDDPLLILRIDDSGTLGLEGDEDEPAGNFNALCRNVLVTGEGTQFRGGSFGLGKSMLWRFSMPSTVLFSSRIGPSQEFRFFGRTELPFHRTEDGDWDGPGWYGIEQEVGHGMKRAVSAWGNLAEITAKQVNLFRPAQLGTGTSILIMSFFEPQREEPRELEDLASDILNSATRWFWPSIINKTMRVVVQVFVNGSVTYERDAAITPEVEPFTLAMPPSRTIPRVSEPGDIAERILSFRIPARKLQGPMRSSQESESELLFRLRLAGTEESPGLRNRIALMRGAGMVVKYCVSSARIGQTEVDFSLHF